MESKTISSPEREELTQDGLRRVFPALNRGQEGLDWEKSMRKPLRGFKAPKISVTKKIKDNWVMHSGAAGVLVAAEEAMRQYSYYPWDKEPLPAMKSSTSTTHTTVSTKPSKT